MDLWLSKSAGYSNKASEDITASAPVASKQRCTSSKLSTSARACAGLQRSPGGAENV